MMGLGLRQAYGRTGEPQMIYRSVQRGTTLLFICAKEGALEAPRLRAIVCSRGIQVALGRVGDSW